MNIIFLLITSAALAMAQTAIDSVAVTMKSSTDGSTRSILITGESAKLINQAAEYVAKTSCNPTCQYTNNIDVIRKNIAAFAVTVLATIPGSKLADLTAAQKAAEDALQAESKRVLSAIDAVPIVQ